MYDKEEVVEMGLLTNSKSKPAFQLKGLALPQYFCRQNDFCVTF